MRTYCSVPGCGTSRAQAMLHKLPKRKKQLKKWLDNIICSYPNWIDSLEKSQSLLVCHKHFEARFVASGSNLKSTAYPTLFSKSEIVSGVPENRTFLTPDADGSAIVDHQYARKRHVDHNYCAEIDEEPPGESSINHSHDASNLPDVLQNLQTISEDDTFENLDNGFNEDDLSSQQENLPTDLTIESVSHRVPTLRIETQSNVVDSEGNQFLPLTFTWNESQANKNGQPTDPIQKTVMFQVSRNVNGNAAEGERYLQQEKLPSTVKPQPITTDKVRQFHKVKNVSPECQKLYRECKNLKKRLENMRRAKKASKLTKEQSFEKLFKKVQPAAKQFIWMQVKLSSKKGRGRRFSLEDKMFALGLLKEAPKSYQLLKTMFVLPSIKTLQTLASQLQVDLSANAQKKPVKEATRNDYDESTDAPSPRRPTINSTTLQANKYSTYGEYIAEKLSNMPHHKASYCQRIMNDAILMAEANTLNVDVVNNFSAQAFSHYVSDPWGSDIRYLNS